MEVKLAKSLGFCFGVKRAIKLAEAHPNTTTIGPIIHNPKEIARLKKSFLIDVTDDIDELKNKQQALIRTHGITKQDYKKLKSKDIDIIDATCPFVSKPQQICEDMNSQGYDIVIFGDKSHPEIKGIMSYATNPIVILTPSELENYTLSDRIAVISQTTKKKQDFSKIVEYLVYDHKEVRVFNTICNATFENQSAAISLSKDVDIMIIIGGKNSSNTKQLLNIAEENCKKSYLIEDIDDLDKSWFINKKTCGISAGASTPQWLIDEIVAYIQKI